MDFFSVPEASNDLRGLLDASALNEAATEPQIHNGAILSKANKVWIGVGLAGSALLHAHLNNTPESDRVCAASWDALHVQVWGSASHAELIVVCPTDLDLSLTFAVSHHLLSILPKAEVTVFGQLMRHDSPFLSGAHASVYGIGGAGLSVPRLPANVIVSGLAAAILSNIATHPEFHTRFCASGYLSVLEGLVPSVDSVAALGQAAHLSASAASIKRELARVSLTTETKRNTLYL
jgi:hypothetical protein